MAVAYEDLQQHILDESEARQNYWRDRDVGMDAALMTFARVDPLQDSKAPGFAKFKMNWPTEVHDKGVEIMNGNPPRYRIPIDDSQPEEKDLKSRVERFIRGGFSAVDTTLMQRGWSGGARRIAASHLLLRGCAVSHLALTRESDYDHPFLYDWWDPRYTYPYFDRKGLNTVLYTLETDYADILGEYPDAPIEGDMRERARKYIYYDRDWYGVLCEWTPRNGRRRRFGFGGSSKEDNGLAWLSKDPDTGSPGPFLHELERIPVIIAPARQVAVLHTPRLDQGRQDANNTGLRLSAIPTQPPLSPQALWARSIYATVSDAIPQFNETMAQLMQIIRVTAFGVWKGYSRDGKAKPWKVDGSGSINWMKKGFEDLVRMDAGAVPPGVDGMLNTLFREIQTGTIPADLLSTFSRATSGFDRAQIIAVAMNALGGYMDVFNAWEEQVAQEMIRQFRNGNFETTLTGFDARRSAFEQTFASSEIQKFYSIRVLRNASLPEDEARRAEIARTLLDPALPLKSYETVADEVLEIDDPQLERDKVAEDKAETLEIVQFVKLVRALQRRGASAEELAALMQMAQLAQMKVGVQAGQGQMMIAQIQSALHPTGMSPETLPPEAANPSVEPGVRGQAPPNEPQAPAGPPLAGPNGVPLRSR